LGPGKKLPIPSAVAEFFGDTMLVNGLVYPWKNVDAGAYRMRLLNACNSRFLNLSFVFDDGTGEPAGGYLAPTRAPVDAWLIGTEGGFLPAPVQIFSNGNPVAGFLATPFNPGPLLVGPAERFDVIVDFSQCSGQQVLLYNDAQGPFPAGAPIFDFYPGAVGNPVITTPGPVQTPDAHALQRELAVFQCLLQAITTAMVGANPVLPTVFDPVQSAV
jgi:spore coat protein A